MWQLLAKSLQPVVIGINSSPKLNFNLQGTCALKEKYVQLQSIQFPG